MELTCHQSSVSVDTGISFPKLECWNALTKVATIAAVVNRKRVLCRISLEILRDKFGAFAEEESMMLVARHRTAIQAAAQKLIESENYEPDGSVLIRAHDLA